MFNCINYLNGVCQVANSGCYPEDCPWKTTNDVLSIPDLAQALGKEPVKRTLPNGSVVEQIVWEGGDLPKIAQLLHNRSGDMPEHVKIDGPAPAWLVAALAHECHPRAVSLNSPDGFVPVGCRRPEGPGAGANLIFSVEEKDNGWLLVICRLTDPAVPLSPSDLAHIVPPAVPMGAKVILSGRMPNWLAASLAMAYHGIAKAVALFQPGTGATVAWTHSKEVRLGEVIEL
jgi:CRISPR-associated Csx3 family protein